MVDVSGEPAVGEAQRLRLDRDDVVRGGAAAVFLDRGIGDAGALDRDRDRIVATRDGGVDGGAQGAGAGVQHVARQVAIDLGGEQVAQRVGLGHHRGDDVGAGDHGAATRR